MWMMGCSDGGDQINLADSLTNARKLRQLLPRPSTISTATNNNSFNHLLGSGADQQCKRDLNTQSAVVVSSRWNPTPEQLHILEELYRRGTRTPSTDHIQHITTQLRRYGKIEGKNVFYWFQNHKARERQKRRRQHHSPNSSDHHFGDIQADNNERKSELSSAGANRTGIEVEQTTKSWGAYSTTFAEKNGTSKGRKENVGGSERWEGVGNELEGRRSLCISDRNATWQKMGCSSSSTVSIHSPPTNTAAINSRRLFKRTMEADLITPSAVFLGPHCNSLNQTLELFPLRSTTQINGTCSHKENGVNENGNNNNVNLSSTTAPCLKYFEFLPLKN